MEHIALYGKGGVGKTTLASNLAAALAESGRRVMLIGCDSGGESASLVTGCRNRRTVTDAVGSSSAPSVDDIVAIGFSGVACIELGDIFASGECAGQGFADALSLFDRLRIFEIFKPDVVFYDLPGDRICGGLTLPLKSPRIDRVYVVTSSDFVSLSAANSILRAVGKYAMKGGARLGGVIANALTTSFAESFVGDFAARTGSRMTACIPRSLAVLQSELYGKTVIEAAPESNHAYVYRRLAQTLMDDRRTTVPTPLAAGDLQRWAREWGDRILELETGVIHAGEAI